MKKLKSLSFLLACLVILVLAACGGSSEESSESSTPDESSSQSSGETKEGGVLKIGALQGLQNLGLASELRAVDDFFISEPALEKLGRFDENGEVQPLLAESWDIDPEAKTITFKLKEGILFHDGTDFNAEAVKWNIEEHIESGRSELSDIDSVEVADEYTVVVNLKDWNNSMLNAICNFVPITSPTAYEENGRDWAIENPVGTGPFKFISWDKNESVKYEKFEDYWQEGKPYLDGIEFYMYADSTTAAVSMEAGEIDVFLQAPHLNAKDLSQVDGITVLTNETGLGSQMQGIMFNSVDESSPLYDPKVRKAVSLAIDRDTIVNTFLHGYAVVTNQWGAPSSMVYNDEVDIEYDPERAKELLAEAGYPDGFKTKLTLRNDPAEIEIGTGIAGYLSQVGIEADINVIDSGLWREITHASGDQFEEIIFLSGRSDPDLAMYMSRNFSSNGVIYSHGINHPEEVDAIYPELKGAADQQKALELSFELQKLVFDEYALAAPVYVSALPVPVYDYVQDSGINDAHGSEWTPESVWLNK